MTRWLNGMASALALLDSPYGLWAFLLWFGLTILVAVIDVSAGLSAGVVFRWARPIDRASDSTYYVFTLGWSIIIAAIAAVGALFIAVVRLG